MTEASSSLVQVASIVAAVLVAGVAAFQLSLAAGVPLGGAVFGGKAPTEDGVLTGPFRLLAVAQAALLALIGWVFLARAGTATMPWLSAGTLRWLMWVIVGFLVLNTLGNATAPHPVERWVMGSVTLVLALLGTLIALSS
jgi:hypothetical protein